MSGSDSVTELMEQANEEWGRRGKSPSIEIRREERDDDSSKRRNRRNRRTSGASGSEEDSPKQKKRKEETTSKAARRKRKTSRSDSEGSGKGKKRAHKRDKDDGSEAEAGSRRKRAKKKVSDSSGPDSSDSDSDECFDNFTKLAGIWKFETRPRFMQKRKVVNGMEWKEIMDTKREYREECRQNGMGESAFAADANIRSTKFAAAKDNRADKLHPASFLRMPIVDPVEYWRRIPLKREPIYRNIPLKHCNGNVVVNELAIVRMHDRTATVTLKMFLDTNFAKRPGKDASTLDSDWEGPTKLRAVQSAIYSWQAVLRALWPMDATPEAVGQLLVKMDWGGSQRQDTARAALVEQFFNRAMIESAQLAVGRKPPADYR